MPHVPVGKMDGRVSVLPSLPEKWLWTSIASVASVTGGLTKNAQRRSLRTKVRYLRVANVYANELRLDDVSEIGCTQPELEKTRLMPGDLLIVEGNGSPEQIGRVAVWNGEVQECSHQNHLIRARLGPFALPKFALYWILSPASRSAIKEVASSSSGLYTLSISKVEGLPIPICSDAEQEAIILKIDEAFARIDELFAEASRAASLLDRLDPATLAKAFRGELVTEA
jgi:type I restriction enzyme S subunit